MLVTPHLQHRGSGGQVSSFPLFTAIKPPTGDIELVYLRECLNSWRTAGFDAISVTGPAETERLRGLDLSVAFHSAAADSKPRIGTILGAIRENGARFASIINSDCKIVNYPGLVANLKAHMDRTVVLARRVDLGLDLNPTTQRRGFGYFFFSRQAHAPRGCRLSLPSPGAAPLVAAP